MSADGPSPVACRRFARTAGFLFGLVVVLLFVHVYLDLTGHFLGEQTERLVAGESRRPYADRVLTPAAIRGGIALLPERTIHRLNFSRRGEVPRRLDAMVGYEWSGERGEVFVLVYAIVLACGTALLLTFRRLLRIRGESAATVTVGSAVILLALPALYSKSGMPYDLPELALFALGLLLALERRWIGYYVVFVLAVLNKETGVLMGAYLLPMLAARERRRFLAHAGVHVAIAVPALVAIRWFHRGLPGTVADVNLAKNLAFFASTEPWLKFADLYAHQIPFPRAFNLLSLALVAGPLWLARRRLPRDLRWMLAGLLVPLAPLFLVLGNQDEIRVFAPAAPVLALLLARAVSVLLEGARDPVDGSGLGGGASPASPRAPR